MCVVLEIHLRVFALDMFQFRSTDGYECLNVMQVQLSLKASLNLYTLLMLAHRNSWPENGRSWLRWTGATWRTLFQRVKSKGRFKMI